MSDNEEPAAKMSKLDELAGEVVEEMDNGQEEWLSEEILTDDDYNATGDQDQDHSDSNANTSQEEGNTDSMDQGSQDVPNSGENIERTLNNLENSTTSTQAELPEELGAFLVRKTDKQVVDDQPIKEAESELDESTKQSEDDGNDTDDLLRMLGEDDSKKKEASASQSVQLKDEVHSSDEDDDEYIFEGATVKTLKVSKELLSKENKAKKLIVSKGSFIEKPASRAVPEDTSDREADNHVSSKVSTITKIKAVKLESKDARNRKLVSKAVPEDLSDMDEDSIQKHSLSSNIKSRTSSDEASTMKRMFDVRQTRVLSAGRGMGRRKGINAVKTVTKRVISIDPKGPTITQSAPINPPLKFITQLPAKPPLVQRRLKPPAHPAPPPPPPPARVKNEPDDVDDDDHLNDDVHDMDSDMEEGGQRLMKPERMDEEVPSDAESHSEEDSYYDEMPSSESEDADDWFTLDLRGERAADYIPMLGENAKALLLAEQQRASARLGALRRSAGALVAGRRALADQLRATRTSLAHVDAALAQ